MKALASIRMSRKGKGGKAGVVVDVLVVRQSVVEWSSIAVVMEMCGRDCIW